MCFLLKRGTHLHKNHQHISPKNKTCCQNDVGYIKTSRWCRIHHCSRPKKPPVATKIYENQCKYMKIQRNDINFCSFYSFFALSGTGNQSLRTTPPCRPRLLLHLRLLPLSHKIGLSADHAFAPIVLTICRCSKIHVRRV